VAYFPWISICKNQTLAAALRDWFTVAHRNWSREEDEDVTAKLPIVFLESEDVTAKLPIVFLHPPPSPEPGGATPPPWAATVAHQAVCCPRWAPPWSPLCFAVFSVAFGAPERPGHRALVSRPPSNCAAVGCAEADLHHPSMDQWPGLEAVYPFICIKSTS
jgi:hypothetical protein